jgi:2-polyprenyl-3-methyl-5-hydroxy-6-metoxy-1,4-benzoquinol methylase
MKPQAVVDACPLCGSREGKALESVEYSRIWAALESDWSARFSPEVIDRHTPAPRTEIHECARCGLHYFAPSLAGDAEFYEQLMAGARYEEDRWEFGIVADLLRAGDAVLDVGCGRGAFLKRIGPRVARAAGVDANRNAIAELASSGIEAHADPFGEFAAAERRAFDVICAFQTVEHLPRVGDLVEPALGCLRPGGRLFLSVPNRERAWREPFEPFDYPPHHISRWHRAQLGVLAKRYGMALRTVECEPPNMSMLRDLKRAAPRRRLSPVLGPRGADLAARACGRALVGPRRHTRAVETGKLDRRGIYGHTMLAELVLEG